MRRSDLLRLLSRYGLIIRLHLVLRFSLLEAVRPVEVQAGRSGWRATMSGARLRRPTSVAAKRRCTARVRRAVLPSLLVAGTVAFCPAAMAAPSATPSPSPSPTSASPTPEPSSPSPTSSPTPSPTSPAPSPTSPAPTPSPTSPLPTPSPTSPKPSPAPSTAPAPAPSPTGGGKPPHTPSPAPSPSPSSWSAGAPGPAPAWPSFAAHTPRHAHVKKGHGVTAAVKAPATSHASAGASTPLASIGAGRPQPDGTGAAVVAAFAALLAGIALVTGRWMRLSLRRRAHPPRHAFRTPAPGGHRRPRGTDDDWEF